MSPLAIYHINYNASSNDLRCENDVDEICVKDTSLVWRLTESCKASLICPRLDGNVCGDYGLTIAFTPHWLQDSLVSEYAGFKSVCHEGHLTTGMLSTNDRMQFSIWKHKDADDVSGFCYFWCTRDGTIPSARVAAVKPPDNLDNELESGARNIHKLDGQSEVFISPVALHSVPENGSNWIGTTCNDAHRCEAGIVFRWNHPWVCNATFMCPVLLGDPCAGTFTYRQPQ